MIDPHVHLRDWNQKDKETIGHGLSLYKRAGFSWVFDMPNTNPPLTSEECILKRLEEGEGIGKAYGIRYSVYAGLTSDENQIEAMVKLQNKLFPRIIGLKLFLSNSTGNMGITTIDDQRRVIRILSECGYKGVLVVHVIHLQQERMVRRANVSCTFRAQFNVGHTFRRVSIKNPLRSYLKSAGLYRSPLQIHRCPRFVVIVGRKLDKPSVDFHALAMRVLRDIEKRVYPEIIIRVLLDAYQTVVHQPGKITLGVRQCSGQGSFACIVVASGEAGQQHSQQCGGK